MKHDWRWELGAPRSPLVSKYKVDQLIANIDVNYDTGFGEAGPICDIALDEVEVKYLLSGGFGGELDIYNLEDVLINKEKVRYKRITTIKNQKNPSAIHSSSFICVQWYPVDTGLFITTSVDKCLKIWDTNREQVSYLLYLVLSLSLAICKMDQDTIFFPLDDPNNCKCFHYIHSKRMFFV
ncbi:unnamed protein product [Protopolystoma xenopodis]|uniref:Uncharacterized protein n=1 Tax=Protopolystoma xenopodis TaxID=117903 RepID=A0A3S5CL90_9PLAT|nr:unnamed protein product [Protopolystoma xenopodis]